MKHMTCSESLGLTPAELAERIGNLRYDELALFAEELQQKLQRDAVADAARGRPKLARELMGAAAFFSCARDGLVRAWSQCVKYM